MPNARRPLAALFILIAIGATAACGFRPSQKDQPMKPTVTYLYLLRHTPFFTELNTDQLRWVIQHSREWEVQAGQSIVSSDSTGDGTGYWVLLDGRWDLELEGQHHASGHADPGKWFNRALIPTGAFRLAATEHSFVMNISARDMDEMLAQGFRFDHHLSSGNAFYRELSTSPQVVTAP